MNKAAAALFFSLTSLTGLALADGPDLSKLPAASEKKNLTFAKDIRPLFQASCMRCHGNDRPKGGLSLGSLAAVLKGGKDGQVVIPQKSAESPLLIAVAQIDDDTAMPPKKGPGGGGPGGGGRGRGGPGGGGGNGGPGGRPGGGGLAPKPLTPEQVGIVRAWIDQGAK
jgi:hypothetical protein